MRIVSYSEARNSFKAVLDSVVADYDVAVITRRDGDDAVIMSLAHYKSVMETLHLLASPANAAHLAKAITQDKARQAKAHKLVEA